MLRIILNSWAALTSQANHSDQKHHGTPSLGIEQPTQSQPIHNAGAQYHNAQPL